jgi:hypothetical protein
MGARLRISFITVISSLIFSFPSLGFSAQKGPIIAHNLIGGAGAGSLFGLAIGTMAYGYSGNTEPEYLLNGAVYGFLGGAVIGTGIAFYEIGTERQDSGYTFAEYLTGGTLIGAVLGGVAATIPYIKNDDPEVFTVGIGLGGVIGGTLGIIFSIVDINQRPSGESSQQMFSGKIGVLEMSAGLPSLVPEIETEPIMTCKLAEFRFQ